MVPEAGVLTTCVANRTGRPPRVPGARVVLVHVEMTEAERAAIHEAARLNGQSMSDYIRVNAGGAASDDLELRRGERRRVDVDVPSERRCGSDRRQEGTQE